MSDNAAAPLAAPASAAAAATTTTAAPGPLLVGKSGKKICCACPTTKQARDQCVVANGPEACQDLIDAHKKCLREDGFNID